MTENTDQSNNLSEIIEVRYGNEIYKTWTIKLIKMFVVKFLKEKRLDSLIISELNKIDIIIINKEIDEIIPVEIQKTPIHKGRFRHSDFESYTRTQIEINIDNYGLCWLFFDSEYLRYLQSGNVGKATSINMTWLVKLMKEETLKVFTIKYDGFVKELTTKDFDFLRDISQMCVISCDSDERMLNRNKLKIFRNVIIGYNFTQDEINNFYKYFDNRISKEKDVMTFFGRSANERCKLYGDILHAIGNLPISNMTLDTNIIEFDMHAKQDLVCLGIFDVVGTHKRGNLIRFVDNFKVCKYIPGYMRNKEQWESYRDINLTHETFVMIANGNLKYNKSLMDY